MTKHKNNLVYKLIAVIISIALLAGIIFSSRGLSLTTFAASGTVIGPYTITGGMRNTDYKLEGDVLYILTDVPLTIANTDINTAATVPIVVNADVNGNVTLAGVNIAPTSAAAAINVSPATQSGANVTITIADDTVNTLQGGSKSTYSSYSGYAGLQKEGEYISENEGKLIIQGGTKKNGSLKATGGTAFNGSKPAAGGAGIGSSGFRTSKSHVSNIKISGCVIEAVGGYKSAGIGSCAATCLSTVSHISIINSTVTAAGNEHAAGIGSSSVAGSPSFTIKDLQSSCADVLISSSTIIATGGIYAAGIGSGYAYASASDDYSGSANSITSGIIIDNSMVTATGGLWAPGIGTGHVESYYNTDAASISTDSSCKNMNILKSIIMATGGDYAPAIGTSFGHYSSQISAGEGYAYFTESLDGRSPLENTNIRDSIVTAQAGIGGAPGIGSVFKTSKTMTLNITGSSVNAIPSTLGSYSAQGIGTGVTRSKPSSSYDELGKNIVNYQPSGDGMLIFPVNDSNENLYPISIANPTSGLIVIDGEEFPITKHADDDLNVYAYLTDGFHVVTVDDTSYALNPRTGQTLPLPDVTAPTAIVDLVYNTSEQTLIEAGETSNGTMMYALAKTGPWSTDLPAATNADTYTVWYKSEGDNVTVASTNPESIEVTIAKAPLTFTDVQKNSVTATDIVYEQSLADSTITGTGPVDGQFVWADDTITPIVADSNTTAFNVLFKPTDINYDDYELTCKLKINKKTFTFSDAERNNLVTGDLIYGQNLSQSSISGTTPVAGSYRWVNSTIIPTVGATNNYAIEFVPTDTDNYEISSVGDLHVIVNQADPIITAAQLQALRVSEITYGQTLADSRITASANTPGRFEWASPTTAPSVSDSLQTTYTITFIPTDSVNYKTKDIYTKIKVNPAPFVLAESTINGVSTGAITYGDALVDSAIYGSVPQPGHFEWKTPTITPTVSDSDNTLYTILFVPGDINYTAAEFTKTVHVDKKVFTFTQSEIDNMSASEISYGQTLADSIISGATPTAGQFVWDNPSTAPTVGGANNYAFSFVPEDTANYATVSVGILNVTVNPAVLSTTGTGIAVGRYGQKYSELVVTGLTAMNGEVEVAGTWSLAGSDIPDIPSANKTAVFTPSANANCYETLERSVSINLADDLIVTPTNNNDVLVYGTDFTYDYSVPNKLIILSSKPITIKNADPDTPTSDCIEIAADVAADITLAGVNIDSNCALKIPDDCTKDISITLASNITNHMTSGSGHAGIEKNGNSEDIGKLTITGEGVLTVNGGENAAGIGGGDGKNAANIEISGGGVTALAGTRGAGIGGGSGGDGSNIIISGGNVVATGSTGGSGIGGGYLGEGADITISGGNLKATGGEVLSGGNIFTGAAIGGGVNIINGITVQGESCPITNGTDTVQPLPLVVPGNVSTLEIDGVIHRAMGTDPTIYLTEGTHTVKIDGVTTTYIWSTEEYKWLVSTVVTAPIPKQSLITNGTAQELVSAGSTSGGTLMYALTETGPYTTEIPTAIQAGTYNVWYKVVGDGVYTDVAPASVQVVISSPSHSGGSGSSGGSSRPSSGGGGSSSSGSISLPATTPTFNDKTSSWSAIAKEVSKLDKGSDVAISLNGGTTAPAEIMEAIAENNLKSTFVIDSTFSWVIDGATIDDPSIVDLTFTKVTDIDTSSLAGINGTQFKINNTNADTELSVSFKQEHAGSFANVYKQTATGLEFVSCAKIESDGKAILHDVSSRGKYAVMLHTYSDMPGDANSNGVLELLDAMEILRYSIGIITIKNPVVANVNKDTYVNAKDALAVLRKVIGI